MSNVTTIASHFSVDSAPANETVKLSGKGPQRLVLDILSLQGGSTPTVRAVLTELIPSVKEIQVLSVDGNALDTFTAGRVVRGRESGKHATVTGQRTASGTHYLSYADSGPSKFFVGETIEERGLTGSDTAALAVVDSLPIQAHIVGQQIADTTAVRVDTAVDIAQGTKDRPAPHRPRLARLSYAFAGGPSNVSFVVRVAG